MEKGSGPDCGGRCGEWMSRGRVLYEFWQKGIGDFLGQLSYVSNHKNLYKIRLRLRSRIFAFGVDIAL